MSAIPQSPLRDFDDVNRDLERVIAELKRTPKPQQRLKLLRELRSLLEQADRINLADSDF
jgi:hypothetical protein